ncbi:MAG: hypothetical protein K6G26_08850 [Lachnospiraceae bacterium]|nr:hypothetical protein [Lachnospiraceae bacterium]
MQKEVGYKKVLKTFVSSKEKLIHVKVGETFIETTEGHPFWVVGYGFKYSHDLEVGDHVITAEGIEAEALGKGGSGTPNLTRKQAFNEAKN